MLSTPVKREKMCFRMLLLLGLYGLGLHAIEVTVCDCSASAEKGILQFSDENCFSEPNPNKTNEVKYEVYKEKREGIKFPGYLCAKWKQIKHITTSFFGQKVVVPDKLALETSPLECLTMYESRRCNEQPMTILDNKFIYDQEPEETGWWLETITVETINCAVEKIQLYQENEGESFSTPLGVVPATNGSISHNHLTLIWDKTFTIKSERKARLVESGEGVIIPTTILNKFRLHDEKKELEFHLHVQPRCYPSKTNCVNKTDAFEVIGQPQLYILATAIIPKEKQIKEETNSRKQQALNNDANVDIVANFQYLRDQLLDNENDLTRELNTLQCEKRKAVHERVVSTAQLNGWLAASMINLPKCTKLSAFGKTVMAISCKVRNVTFSAEMTSCGPQPKFEKYTINRDGWELVPFSPCYWAVGFVNFNDQPYAYSNGSWKKIEATVVVPTQTLAHSFRYNEVKYFDYVHQSNPAYNDALLDSMNVLADIASTINDHSAGNFTPSHLPKTNNILVNADELSVFPDWISNVKKYFIITVVIIIVVIILRVCVACGCCGLLEHLCCFLCNPKESDVNTELRARSNV